MLQELLPDLESLSEPSDVRLNQSITLPINWTQVTLMEDLLLEGTNDSTQILNMSGLPSLFSLGSKNSTLSLRNLVMVDGCIQYNVNNSQLLSIQQLPFMVTMASISYPRTSNLGMLSSPYQAVFAQEVTFVVTPDEIMSIMYWYLALSSPLTFLNIPNLAPFMFQFPVQTLVLSSFSSLDNLNVAIMQSASFLYQNVVVTSSYSPSYNSSVTITASSNGPLFACQAPEGNILSPSLGFTHTFLNVVNSTDSLAAFLANITTYIHGLIPATSKNYISAFPLMLMLSGDAILSSGALTWSTLMTGTPGDLNPDSISVTPFIQLDLANTSNLVDLVTPPWTVLTYNLPPAFYLSWLLLHNPVVEPFPAPAVQLSALPLWAFNSGNRSENSLQLYNCTAVLLAADFVQLYLVASEGADWKTNTEPTNVLVQGSTIFNVLMYSSTGILFSHYTGWGLNATNFWVVPDDKSQAAALIAAGAVVAPLPVPPPSSPSSSLPLSTQLGIGLGCAAFMVLVAASMWGFTIWLRRRKQEEHRQKELELEALERSLSLASISMNRSGDFTVLPLYLQPNAQIRELSLSQILPSLHQQDGGEVTESAPQLLSMKLNPIPMAPTSNTPPPLTLAVSLAPSQHQQHLLSLAAGKTSTLDSEHNSSSRGSMPQKAVVASSGTGWGACITAGKGGSDALTPATGTRTGSSALSPNVRRSVETEGSRLRSGSVNMLRLPPEDGLSPPNLGLWRQLCDESKVPALAGPPASPSSQSTAYQKVNVPHTSVFQPSESGYSAPAAYLSSASTFPAATVVDPYGQRDDAASHAMEAGRSYAPSAVSAKSWDPRKEIDSLAKELSQEANKLVLLEPIGQGGFGTVYRGRWRNLEVAVKTVLFSESTSSNATRQAAQPQQRAIMEAAVCTSVIHQNVVTTYHYDLTRVNAGTETRGASGMTIIKGANMDWKLYLVQEYCNASLQDALRNKLLHKADTKQPDMDLVLSVLMDISRGMMYIHDKNIIHGDLTPGNVLLKQDPTSPIGLVGKITDFGLCTTIEPGKTHISNVTIGTPFYVAPEVVSNGMLTKTSDVYSFGVLMWELYRCMPPWVKTETGYAQNKRFRRFPFDSPRIYVALCARCLDKNPKSRPSFSEILNDLNVMHAAYLAGYDSLEDGKVLTTAAPAQKRTSGDATLEATARTCIPPLPSIPTLDVDMLEGELPASHLPLA
ncbi:hypothetical protein CEUSTIGMA_g659.t1 [Chlamydomonas eustigma]|uniref:Protein kinase domain-containing protein n=1 Tax=Chlamydomonas eustigma TaxID=1157962 RepID=A0A250WR78_9CHLO|nr:hypothetical protein CEUSTIGMA_g659.t1 [Chlamydomonas eustigma]|eukprot:GAX73206.1 hypothetical protein CEUSTIGMA_g659.t1 [Chlamydomonas eustigma]